MSVERPAASLVLPGSQVGGSYGVGGALLRSARLRRLQGPSRVFALTLQCLRDPPQSDFFLLPKLAPGPLSTPLSSTSPLAGSYQPFRFQLRCPFLPRPFLTLQVGIPLGVPMATRAWCQRTLPLGPISCLLAFLHLLSPFLDSFFPSLISSSFSPLQFNALSLYKIETSLIRNVALFLDHMSDLFCLPL